MKLSCAFDDVKIRDDMPGRVVHESRAGAFLRYRAQKEIIRDTAAGDVHDPGTGALENLHDLPLEILSGKRSVAERYKSEWAECEGDSHGLF